MSAVARRPGGWLSGKRWSGHDGGAESVSGTGAAVCAGAHTGQWHTAEQVSGSSGGLGGGTEVAAIAGVFCPKKLVAISVINKTRLADG